MLPIRKNVLSLAEIAELWSREIAGIRTAADIHAELFQAFWLGQLPGRYEGSAKAADRADMLRLIKLNREHPGFLLVEPTDARPPTITKYNDGSVSVDSRRFIKLPADPAQWTDDLVNAACEALAKVRPQVLVMRFFPRSSPSAQQRRLSPNFATRWGIPARAFGSAGSARRSGRRVVNASLGSG